MATVAENLQTIIEIKDNIRTAISNKGVEIPETTPFTLYPEKINEISGGGTDEIFNKLITGTLTEVHSTTPIKNGKYLFIDQKNLRIADVVLNAESAAEQYLSMFKGCSELTTAPALPATTLTNSCYENMFYNCSSLTKAPDLPATILANNCYNFMFYGCTSLTEVPDLPVTTLANYSYYGMFQGCNSLQKTGKISATGDLSSQVQYMFSNCKNLKEMTWTATTPPTIPNNIWNNCPEDMIIYVPDEAVTKYKEAAVWTARAEYIRPMSARPE